jgi:transcriptional regulator with XRE-family HTH domain
MTPKNVRARRIALGMSVAELAKAFGISAELLHDFESGKPSLRDPEQYRPILDRLERDRIPPGC